MQRDLSKLTNQLGELLPGETIKAESNGKNIVLSGQVSNKDMIERAVNLAAGYVDKKEEVLTLLQIRDGAPSNQVLLRVRFAEVSRSAMTELGVNLLTAPYGVKNNVVSTTRPSSSRRRRSPISQSPRPVRAGAATSRRRRARSRSATS